MKILAVADEAFELCKYGTIVVLGFVVGAVAVVAYVW